MHQSLDGFRDFLLENGQQLPTVQTNLKLIKKVLREVTPLGSKSFQEYINTYIREGKNRNYIKQIIIVVRYWGEYRKIKSLKKFPYPKIKKLDTYKRAIMADEEVNAFLKHRNPYKKNSFYWKRFEMWTVFWLICAYHGNRPGEAIKLRKIPTKDEPSYVDFGRNCIIFKAKRRTREVPLSFVVKDKLQWYIDSLVDGEYLFPPVHESQLPYMKSYAWENDFTKRLTAIEPIFPGISHRLNLQPYSLRKSAATRWDDEDWALPKIQEALGHSKLDTTRKYIDVSQMKVAEMINNDRLALPYKKGKEIVASCVDILRDAEKQHIGKMLISSMKVTKNGKRYAIIIEAID